MGGLCKKSILCVLGFCFWGCLAPDPVYESLGNAGHETQTKYQGQVTSAPLMLDASILQTRSFGEAPMLAEKVQRGELPPVSERLPENPLVIVPMDVNLNIALRDILFPRWNSGEFEIFWWWGWSDDAIANRGDWAITGPNQPTWHRHADKEGPEWFLKQPGWLKKWARLWIRYWLEKIWFRFAICLPKMWP